jgi:hypothetical protein
LLVQETQETKDKKEKLENKGDRFKHVDVQYMDWLVLRNSFSATRSSAGAKPAGVPTAAGPPSARARPAAPAKASAVASAHARSVELATPSWGSAGAAPQSAAGPAVAARLNVGIRVEVPPAAAAAAAPPVRAPVPVRAISLDTGHPQFAPALVRCAGVNPWPGSHAFCDWHAHAQELKGLMSRSHSLPAADAAAAASAGAGASTQSPVICHRRACPHWVGSPPAADELFTFCSAACALKYNLDSPDEPASASESTAAAATAALVASFAPAEMPAEHMLATKPLQSPDAMSGIAGFGAPVAGAGADAGIALLPSLA